MFLESCHPTRVLPFYGLDAERYKKGFKDMKKLYKWVTGWRFFSRDLRMRSPSFPCPIIGRCYEQAGSRTTGPSRGRMREQRSGRCGCDIAQRYVW
ncbi:uncharacterized protein BDZ99DRAFT_189031 [Mytilinidion resinicola]|uniref:Uncharacterized protein n=1 Tax=Mytilinidion resinicola TaxID=574789 RepID=A0A6A6Z450_9PEZI|nr:uncharacterized protein BDZ99DRAFT_189031 [Mytilinidion resinicola]KAF2815027.1 hypothetical protein BDZ99DRAFT_189031 [Mytilinidion resinicola]